MSVTTDSSPFFMFSDDGDDDGAALLAVTLNARVGTDDADREVAAVVALRKVAVALAARAACIIATGGGAGRK